MVQKIARATQMLAGFLLGGVVVLAQINNVLICLALIVLGVSALRESM